METIDNVQLELKLEFERAKVYISQEHSSAVIIATDTYMPIEEFKETFHKAGAVIAEHQLTKLVFDKRNLSVFHQPSMEWYFVEWKGEMAKIGLVTHRKLLPQDSVFRQSVKIGRAKIDRDYPDHAYHQLDIGYAEDMKQALEN